MFQRFIKCWTLLTLFVLRDLLYVFSFNFFSLLFGFYYGLISRFTVVSLFSVGYFSCALLLPQMLFSSSFYFSLFDMKWIDSFHITKRLQIVVNSLEMLCDFLDFWAFYLETEKQGCKWKRTIHTHTRTHTNTNTLHKEEKIHIIKRTHVRWLNNWAI